MISESSSADHLLCFFAGDSDACGGMLRFPWGPVADAAAPALPPDPVVPVPLLPPPLPLPLPPPPPTAATPTAVAGADAGAGAGANPRRAVATGATGCA